jgi:endonuclease III
MRGATQCAQRLKKQFAAWRNKHGKVALPAVTDPISQLILGVLSRNMPESKARQVLDALRAQVVDYNELRVIPTYELIEMIGDVPDVNTKAEDILRALNHIFAIEFAVSLDRMRELNKKEAIAYINEIEGLEAYTRARIRLLGLEIHAIPLDEAMWAFARQTEIVDPKCSLEDAHGFLERQISADDALEFVALLQKQAWAQCAAGVRAGEFEHVTSIPPDRASSHMLADVSAPSQPTAPAADSESDAEFDLAEPAEKAEPAEEKAESTKSKPAKSKTKSSTKAKATSAEKPAAKSTGKSKKAVKKAAVKTKDKKTAKASSAKKSSSTKKSTKSTAKKSAKASTKTTPKRKSTRSASDGKSKSTRKRAKAV